MPRVFFWNIDILVFLSSAWHVELLIVVTGYIRCWK